MISRVFQNWVTYINTLPLYVCVCVCVCYTTPMLRIGDYNCVMSQMAVVYDELFSCFEPNCACAPDETCCIVVAVWWLVHQLILYPKEP